MPPLVTFTADIDCVYVVVKVVPLPVMVVEPCVTETVPVVARLFVGATTLPLIDVSVAFTG